MKGNNSKIAILVMTLLVCSVLCGCISDGDVAGQEEVAEFKIVVDMRGVEVTVPTDPQRVIDISRGLVDEVMYIFGNDEIIVGGSFSQSALTEGQYMWNGVDYTVNTYISKCLMPRLNDSEEVTNVGGFGGPYGGVPNVETILSLAPDLVILRDFGGDDENTINFIQLVEETGIPVVVLKYPDCFDVASPDTIYEEIRVLGEVFGDEDKASEIIAMLKERVDMIEERTATLEESERKSVLFFGAPTWASDKGGVGVTFGSGTIEVAFLEAIINAESAYSDSGRNLVSAEQVLSMDPDVILLPTWSGYHAPRQLYEEAYDSISDLRAIQDNEVYSLATTPVNSQRLEFPINLMIAAKSTYPELFTDIDIEAWIRDFLKELYGVDDELCDEMMDALMLEYLEII